MKATRRYSIVVAGVVGAFAVAALLAWAARPDAKSAQGQTERTIRTTIYFLTDDGAAPLGVRKSIAARSPYARQALLALLRGPTREEAAAGLTTALPPDTRIRSFEIRRSEVAHIDLSGLPQPEDDILRTARTVTQVLRTIVGLSGVNQLYLYADGKPFGLPTVQQTIKAGPYGYENIGRGPMCVGKPGTEIEVAACFTPIP